MARRGRKKSTGSCLLPIVVIVFILGAIGVIGGKKDKTSSVPERTRNESTVVDNKRETTKSEKETVAKSEKEVKTVIPDKGDNSSSSQIETAVTEKKEVGNETARDSLLKSNIRTKELKETEAVKQDSSESAVDVVPDAVASTEVKFESIKRGDSGDSVKEVQTQLIALGLLASSADGKFGSGTEQAVIDFQNVNHLKPTGVIDKATYDAILSANSEEKEFSSIKRGDSGDSVVEIQKRLSDLGYLNSSVDGKFGSGTEQAVKDFQGANSLSASGVVDESTYNILFSSGAKRHVAPILISDVDESAADVGTRNSSEPLVWIPNSGKKYHSNSGCSNMKNPTQVTRSQAETMGYTPCSKCY